MSGETVLASPLLSLCDEYHAAAAAVPLLTQALLASLDEANRLQVLLHDTEDRRDEVLEALEAMPATTLAEAQAKLLVAEAVVSEGLDPKRHEFLAAALTEAQSIA